MRTVTSPPDDAPSPHDIVARCRGGDADALAEIYRRHGGVLLALARRLTGSAADAEDVLHDVFLALPEALWRYEGRGSLEGWLRRVTARVALTRLRSRRRKREVSLEFAPEPSRRADADTLGARGVLERAVAALPESLRTVFVMREIEGMSHAEVASLLGISQNAAEVRLCRALKRLRESLKEIA